MVVSNAFLIYPQINTMGKRLFEMQAITKLFKGKNKQANKQTSSVLLVFLYLFQIAFKMYV